jgi:two-component system sensor histidine kinase ChvG
VKLRRQLILVSLLTLSLPWAGCQYLREMEDALREGQGRALLATAEAVANRIASEPILIAALTQNFADVATAPQFYAHPFATAVVLDGYDDEWRNRELVKKQWQADNFRVQIQMGFFNKNLYAFIEVDDRQLDYYHPGQQALTANDHLLLRTLDRDGRVRDFVVVASAPGTTHAFDINTPHHQWLTNQAQHQEQERNQEQEPAQDHTDNYTPIQLPRQEHSIHGIWQETSTGYQLELQIPWYLTQGYLGVAVINHDAHQPQWLGTIAADSPPAPLVRHSELLTEALSVFAADDLRLRLATNNQWLIAEAGRLPSAAPELFQGGLTSLFRNIFSQQRFPGLDQPERDGRLETNEITAALTGQEAVAWYRHRQETIARAAVPIRLNQHTIGAVVAEQTSAGLLALTDNAFQRLVFYTFLATGCAGLGLIAYASWLSLRIRRLSRAADSAIRDDQQLEDAFVPSNAQDEIGDLSRSYNRLLMRVQEYTEYLRTLSNKLSHELRTPLAVVRSSLDNLDNEQLPESARVFAERAQQGSQRLSTILTAISSASRVEESIRQAEMAFFPLDKVVAELALAYQDVTPQKIRCKISPEQNYVLYGSADLIVQMMDKLFDNACDFCPSDGEIALVLARHKNVITLTVSNDGPLLPDKMQSQLFDSLVSLREKTGTSPDNKIHLGLGLHIVRLIVDLHQGRVVARNRADHKGVEFEISFTVDT